MINVIPGTWTWNFNYRSAELPLLLNVTFITTSLMHEHMNGYNFQGRTVQLNISVLMLSQANVCIIDQVQFLSHWKAMLHICCLQWNTVLYSATMFAHWMVPDSVITVSYINKTTAQMVVSWKAMLHVICCLQWHSVSDCSINDQSPSKL